jgi:hypothetical protein
MGREFWSAPTCRRFGLTRVLKAVALLKVLTRQPPAKAATGRRTPKSFVAIRRELKAYRTTAGLATVR